MSENLNNNANTVDEKYINKADMRFMYRDLRQRIAQGGGGDVIDDDADASDMEHTWSAKKLSELLAAKSIARVYTGEDSFPVYEGDIFYKEDENAFYKALMDIENFEPWNSSHWEAIDFSGSIINDITILKADFAKKADAIHDTVSGNLVHIFYGADNAPVSNMMVQINPDQLGSGDPSPDNIRRIRGLSGTNIWVINSKNLYHSSSIVRNLNINPATGIVENKNGCKAVVFDIWPGSYTLSVVGMNTDGCFACFSEEPTSSGKIATAYTNITDTGKNGTIIVPDGSKYGMFVYNDTMATQTYTEDEILDSIQLEHGSAATSYTSFDGQNYSIGWYGQLMKAVYGGYLNPVTGELVITHDCINSYNSESLPGKWISDRDVYVVGATPTIGAQVVYELAEPVRHQLGSTQIYTQLGENYIYATTGQIYLEYLVDAKEYIDNAPRANPKFTGSISMGRAANTTVGNGSFAVGLGVEASGNYSHAEGTGSIARGATSHAEGMSTASGMFSHAEGTGTASGMTSHAEGMGTASGNFSHAEGTGTASGNYSHAEGMGTASGNYSHAGGNNTIANSLSQSTFGEYNVADPGFTSAGSRGTYIEIVGNGTGNNSRSNARTLDWNGNEELAGDLTIKKGSADEVSVSELADDVGDLKSAIEGKADEPTGTKSAGKVYGLDSNLTPVWLNQSGGGLNWVENNLNDWLFAENAYYDSSFELTQLNGYNTYKIPCSYTDYVVLMWTGASPFGALGNNYWYTYENGSGLSRTLTGSNYKVEQADRKIAFIAPSGTKAIYFTFKADLLAGLTVVKNTARKYVDGFDTADNFVVPVNASTAIDARFYLRTVSGNNAIYTYTNSSYHTWWIHVKTGDTIKFESAVEGVSFYAVYYNSSDVATQITALSHTFETDATVVVFEQADTSNNAVIIPAGAKLAIEAENVFDLKKAVESLMPDYEGEIEALDTRVDSIEAKLDSSDITYSTGDESGYYRVRNNAIEKASSSSFTCRIVEVTDAMLSVSFQIKSTSGISTNIIYCGFADSNHDLISMVEVAVGTYDIEIPSTAKYLYLSFFGDTYNTAYTIKANALVTQKDLNALGISNTFDGLSAVAFGTSLTYRAQTTGGYLQFLPDLSGMNFDNQGIGSSSIMSNGGGLDMLAHIKAYTGYSNKNVCLLEGFVNDWYGNNPIGQYTDTEETSVCGCVRSALNYMLSQNANMTIFLILDPYGRNYNNVDCSSSATNGAGLTQYAFYEEIAKVAESLGIPVIKEYSGSQISENTPQYLLDNIHPNALGAKQSANFIWSMMKQYYPNAIS